MSMQGGSGAYVHERRKMTCRDTRLPETTEAEHLWDIAEYCRQAGICRAEEERLIRILGRFASRHELQMNIFRGPSRAR